MPDMVHVTMYCSSFPVQQPVPIPHVKSTCWGLEMNYAPFVRGVHLAFWLTRSHQPDISFTFVNFSGIRVSRYIWTLSLRGMPHPP